MLVYDSNLISAKRHWCRLVYKDLHGSVNITHNNERGIYIYIFHVRFFSISVSGEDFCFGAVLKISFSF